MILNCTTAPQKFVRTFRKDTWLWIQVKTAAPFVLNLSKEQGPATPAASIGSAFVDGIQVTALGTASASGSNPLIIPWRGELWYSASGQASGVAVIEILTDPGDMSVDPAGAGPAPNPGTPQ